jgi:hypothetical protein
MVNVDDYTFGIERVCYATQAAETAVRDWRKRNGLFPHHPAVGKWIRYNVADAVGIRLMVEFRQQKQFEAQYAVDLVNLLRRFIEDAIKAHAKKQSYRLAIDLSPDAISFIEKIPMGPLDPFMYPHKDDSLVIYLDLASRVSKTVKALREFNPTQ